MLSNCWARPWRIKRSLLGPWKAYAFLMFNWNTRCSLLIDQKYTECYEGCLQNVTSLCSNRFMICCTLNQYSVGVRIVFFRCHCTADVTPCLCVEYRAMNAVMKDVRCPLTKFEKMFDDLGESTIFTTINLFCGYRQVRIDDHCKEKINSFADTIRTNFRSCHLGLWMPLLRFREW